jgi:uncharacterized integral membrane protein
MDKLPAIALILGLILAGALTAVNLAMVPFNLLVTTASIPVGAVVFGSFVIGGLLSAFYFASNANRKSAASAKALTKWDAEDQKLLTQVQSDREKQLEAKIATLESALQRALKK